jgi:hypothetical protein
MSRVEDDRQAARLQERIAQEKKLAEAKGKKLQEGATTFSKLVQQQQAPQQKQAPQTPEGKQNLGQSVLQRATQEGGGAYGAALRQNKGTEERVTANAGDPSARPEAQQEQQASVGRREDHKVSESRVEARTSESREERETSNERNAESSLGRATQSKGALKTDTESGGKGGGKDKEKDGKSGEMAAAGFRFNPALMAPVPVAQPKPTGGSERLRAIANEIAQKIVERVRVGTNAMGNAEFQIDLRGDVLSGLSIKISARNGKISASFSGSDREVLKMLEQQSEGLKSALSSKGLKLETLRFEAKS